MWAPMKKNGLKWMKKYIFPDEYFVTNEVKKFNASLCKSNMQRNKILYETRSCYVAQANFKILCSGDPSGPVPSASALWQLVEKIFKRTL